MVQDSTRRYKTVQERYKKVQRGTRTEQEGTRLYKICLERYILVHTGTYWYKLRCSDQPGYACLLDSLLQFFPAGSAVFETNASTSTFQSSLDTSAPLGAPGSGRLCAGAFACARRRMRLRKMHLMRPRWRRRGWCCSGPSCAGEGVV